AAGIDDDRVHRRAHISLHFGDCYFADGNPLRHEPGPSEGSDLEALAVHAEHEIAFKLTRRNAMKRFAWLKPCSLVVLAALLMCGLPAWAQSQAPASTTAAASTPAPAATPAPDAVITTSAPSADDLAAGDPSGSKTGTANDVVKADPN